MESTLDVKRHHLKAFHEAWKEYLANSGYRVFRVRDYIPEIPPDIPRALDLPIYLYKRENFMPEAKKLYQKVRTEARRLMEMKMRSPTTTAEREVREKKEAQLQPQSQSKLELQQQQRQQQQAQNQRPKNLDEFVLAFARNLLEAGRPREAVFIQLYNYLKKHPEKAYTAYVSNLVRKAWLSLMEKRRRKSQRDYSEPGEFLGPGL